MPSTQQEPIPTVARIRLIGASNDGQSRETRLVARHRIEISNRRHQRSRRRMGRRLLCEPLEPRALLSATLTLVIADNSIAENAGSSATTATVTRSPAAVKLTPSDGASSDHFSWSVAISDATAIVGSRDDDDQGTNSGAAYIFERGNGSWQQAAKLTADTGTDYANFGVSVSISGTTAIVGAQWDDSACHYCGAAYIFEKSEDTWRQVARLTAEDPAFMDAFGNAVSISGTTAIVGAGMDDDKGEDSGSAYVFERTEGVWRQMAKLTAGDGAAFDSFGGRPQSVAISGDFAVVGALADDDRGDASGAAYIFERSGGTWRQAAKLTASDGAANDVFGTAVSISGNTVLVGAPYDGDNGYQSGSAYIFEYASGRWWQAAKLVAQDARAALDLLGESVAISGGTAIVGARLCDTNGNGSGAAYVFENASGTWRQAAKVLAPDGAAGDAFGSSVSLSSSAVIMGAPNDGGAGADFMGSAYISESLTVSLSSSDRSEATPPAAVTLLPGQSALSFPVAAQDDALLDGTQTVTITASASGYTAGSDTLMVTDQETLSLVIAHDSIYENAGAMATTATVIRSNLGSALTVQLANWDPSEAAIPETVVIPANETSVTFGIAAVDDTVLDGVQTVTLYASAAGYALASDSLDVLDYETLSVVIAASSLSEDGGTATGTVRRNNTDRNSPVWLNLSISDASEASVQRTVTIPAGQAVASFVVSSVDDVVMDGTQTVTITASTLGYIDGTDTLDITDNDVAGITVFTTGELITSEGGGVAWFSLVLDTEPMAPVTVALLGDATEGTFPDSVVFTTDNWDIPQIVNIGGVDDGVLDGEIAYTLQTIAMSHDPGYQGLAAQPVIVTNQDDEVAGVTITPTSGLRTNEAGGTANFVVVLTSRPVADVIIAFSSADPSEGEVTPASLTFTSQNWSVPQTVTVTGVDDSVADGDAAFTVVVAPASSTGPGYDGLDPADVTVTNEDDDTAGITVSAASGSTHEAGGAATFTMVLDSEPTAEVLIGLTSSDVSEATVSPPHVAFTSANWSTPQTVTVRGLDDLLDDGDSVYSIVTARAVSDDPKYNGLDAGDVSLTNTDDDTAGVTVGPLSGPATTEAGGAATFTVVLNSEPAADVMIVLTSGDTSEGTVWPTTLTFTASDWRAPQTVSITGVDDRVDDGDAAFTVIASTAISEDGKYAGMEVTDVCLTNQDDDAVGVTVAETEGRTWVEETGITDAFSVVLDAEPASDVLVLVVCSDPGEVAADRIVLLFTPGTWSIPQIVTVAGVDDGLVDGDQRTTVILSVDDANSDRQFVSLAEQVIFVTTLDNGYHGWQNQTNRFDVDRNGGVSPADVLLVINYINAHSGAAALPPSPPAGSPFFDVNGDGFCTPADVLEVINHINSERVGQGAGEGEAGPQRQAAIDDVWLVVPRVPRSQKVRFSDLTAVACIDEGGEFDFQLADLENVLTCIAEDLLRR